MMYLTRKQIIGTNNQFDEITKESGQLWSNIARRFWQTYRKKDIWLSKSSIQRWLCQSGDVDGLHSQSAQAVADQFYDAIHSWRKQRESNPNIKPPHKQKKFNKIIFKSSAISLKNGSLYLSRGRGYDPIVFDWEYGKPKRAEIGWNDEHDKYELRVQYKAEPEDRTTGDKTAGIDLGEIHLAFVSTRDDCFSLNGKELRAKRQYQNKLKAKLDSKIDRKERGSNRWWKLVNTKNNQLADVRNQIRDICHKMSRKLVEVCLERDVSTLVLGDVRNIRKGMDCGEKRNQQLHQWVHGTFRRMVEYKAKLSGMDVELINEAYTSRTCPDCGVVKDNSPNSRNFQCGDCGFEYHRDGVGAINIRQKYLGDDPSNWADGVPLGIRYRPNMSCNSSSNRKTSLEAVA